MKKNIFILLLTSWLMPVVFAGTERANDVYIIFYATYKGKTGHIGIAVDNYKIIFRDGKGGGAEQVADTVPTGELSYYDLWPNDDYFSVSRTGKDIPAVYYKLPVSSTEEITLNSLYDKGIPHKENYPTDGLLKVPTHWNQDQWIKNYLDSMVSANRDFNAQKFNCTDFVRIPLETLLKQELKCREFILVGWSSTPNKFYRKLRKVRGVEVIKNADDKARRSFIGQRVIYKIFHHSQKIKNHHENQTI